MNQVSSALPVYPIPWLEGETKGPIRIVTAQNEPLPMQKKWLFPHRKDYYMLQYVSKGSGRHWVDMIPYEFKANTLYFSSPGQVHVKEDVRLTGTVITFNTDFLSLEQNRCIDRLPLIRNRQNAHELRIGASEKVELESIIHQCAHEYKQDADLRTEMLCSYVRVLLVFLSRLYNVQYNETKLNPQRDLYRRFQTCLEENYKKTHEAQDYSAMLNISINHLNVLIKEQSGKTITTHVHERLILEAKRMLFHTDQTVKQIAFDLGFHDASYFSRFFKKATSRTALAYRREIGE